MTRRLVVASALVFLFVVCHWRPWTLFDRAGFSNDFYDEQARAFLHGHLAVDPRVPGPEGFVVHGGTYLYYGPFLAIARLPFALFGHVFTARLVRLSMLLGFVTLLVGVARLGDLAEAWAAALARPPRRVWWRTPLLVAAVAASPALFLSGWVSVYHETELWACAFAVWAVVWALRTERSPSRRSAVAAGACVAAATLVRAPVGFGAAAGVGLVALLLWRRARPRTFEMIAVSAAGVAVHLAVNVAKFGSLFGLPGGLQRLSLDDPGRAAWFAGNHGSFFSMRFLPTTLAQYLRPDTLRFDRLAPFVRFGPPAPNYGSYPTETTSPAASLTASATLLLVLGLVGVVVLLRRRAWPWAALTAGATIAAAPSFLIGFIGNRYLVDMLPALIVPAAVTAATLAMPTQRAKRRAVQSLTGALVVWGLWCNVALAVWVQDLKDPGFTAWRYQLDEHLFGGRAPGLVAFDPAAPVPRDGVVGLALGAGYGCNVYIAEQGAWAVLQRSQGPTRLAGRLDVSALPADAPTTVASGTGPDGSGWQLLVTRGTDGHARFSLDAPQLQVTGDDVDLGAPSSSVPVEIVADAVTRELSVRVRATVVLYSFAVPAGGIEAAPVLRPDASPHDSLCRQLVARR